jgi:hypothetical protein
MTTISYPSQAFPAPAAFTIGVPPHWRNIETPDALVAAIDPTGTVFQSNLTVAAERFAVAMSLHQIAANVISDRNERFTRHHAESPTAATHPAGPSVQWSSTFVVELDGEPLVLTQWTMLLDQPATMTLRFVTVATLTVLSTATDTVNAAEILDSLTMVRWLGNKPRTKRGYSSS